MALVLIDRAQESATANTTVSFTLTGAQAGYQSLAGVGDTNTTYYGATDGTNWEVGIGTYSTTGPTLTRTTILSSSNAGSAVSTFTSPLTVWVDYTASKAVTTDTLAYPPAIGSTTPAAGTFTTITGQTGVLKGTGQNLLTYSNTFTNAAWVNTALTIATTVATTDPTGGSNAYSAIETTATSNHTFLQSVTTANGVGYTLSGYFKNASGSRWIMFTNAVGFCHFQPSTGTIGTASGATGSVVSIGNGWYRFSIYFTATIAGSIAYEYRFKQTDNGASSYTGDGTSGFYIYGAQLELGSVTNTYIPTTTTAVYGTPTLSFSGVAGLGLQSDGSLYVSPAGTGALQAQATTSSTVGGNVRGANAVDWQTSRGGAGQVASATDSVIMGGVNNTASGFASVVSGSGNTGSGLYASVFSGDTNTASGAYSLVSGGKSNTGAGYYNFIGGGYTNSGTANAAVTTQSGTMNATTAVTLSGSNASIKVGQFITGTSIASQTYVAAISGTSLTLSQSASGSSTSTLSFYTPHGVVVGGGNNQATGSYSFIGGGGDAGTAANRNVASGDWSVVAGGAKNTASGAGSFVGGGGFNANTFSGNTASGILSTIAGGQGHTASSAGSSVLGGYSNTANGTLSTVGGGRFGTTRAITGNYVIAPCSQPISATLGVSQASFLIVATQTTDATATVLTSDTSAAGTTNQVILPNNSAYYFKVRVIAGVTGAGNTKAWTLEGAIKRGANAASTAIVGSVTTTIVAADVGAATWTVTATADTTNGGLAITFTGQAATTIRVVAKCETAEMTF